MIPASATLFISASGSGSKFSPSIFFVYFGRFPHTGSLWRHPYLKELSCSMRMTVNDVWRRRRRILLKESDGLA